MAVAYSQFVREVSDAGLVAPALLAEVARQHGLGEGDPGHAERLSVALAVSGHITEYQLTHLLKGDLSGLTIGDYIVLDRLGQGAMGEVFKARHRIMDRVVAIKRL